MKTIKNVLLASSMVILSANAFANTSIDGNYGVHHDSKVIKTRAVGTREAAYTLGLEKLELLKSESGCELCTEFALPVGSFQEKNSVALDDGAYITIQESMSEQGDIVYNSLVNVSYSYSQAN